MARSMLALDGMDFEMESMLVLEVINKSGVDDVVTCSTGVGHKTSDTSRTELGGTNSEPMLAGTENGTENSDTMEGMDDETLNAIGELVAMGVVASGNGGTSSTPESSRGAGLGAELRCCGVVAGSGGKRSRDLCANPARTLGGRHPTRGSVGGSLLRLLAMKMANGSFPSTGWSKGRELPGRAKPSPYIEEVTQFLGRLSDQLRCTLLSRSKTVVEST